MNITEQLRAGNKRNTDSQTAAFYYARKRRKARERAGAAEFNKGKPHSLGVTMRVILTVQ